MTIVSSYQYTRVLAIDPSRRGFGFVVLEVEGRLVDWGSAQVWARSDKEFLARVECLVLRYRPAVIVVQEPNERRRSSRALRRIALLQKYACSSGARVAVVSREDVRTAFGGLARTKHEIAEVVAKLYPELRPYLPPTRRPWMSEDDRMNVFDAVALALTAVHGDRPVLIN